ncbi:Telomere length regulator protein [Lachnellula subtilissima]|uniref:Telomere length regulator protein n=1 Tax=Lachnellula subtilissima TaxID=602034 RepID=A0A8H8S309_9HELO|nr:Telomere length regulator protein [Lachnellula subtilissima]
MVEPASIVETTRLPILPTRPPTPPRSSNEGKASFLSRMFYGESRRSSAPASTSNITPESSVEVESSSSSAIARKKVGFSDLAEYKDPPRISLDGKSALLQQPLQSLPPSAERKPTKSILKAYNGLLEQEYNSLGSGTKLLPPHQHNSFAAMLESIVQQLAGKDRDSKQDAYIMLSGALKASENVPDRKALNSKMGLLLQFIMRDLTEKTEAGKQDNPLVINALVLLSSFLQKPSITEAFTSDFPVAFVDHAIKTFEDPQMSKEIVKHLMFAIAQQNFGVKVMSSERVGRLITAVNEIETYVKGKSIVMGQLNIYRTLLRQSRSQMLIHTVWIEKVFTDMLSSNKDIRASAIEFGLESSYTLGLESKASRSASNLFNLEQDDGSKYADFYCARLKTMVEKKQDSACVPRIWSVMILFLRGKNLEQSPFLKLFLAVIQACFNTSDRPTKLEANYAWNRLVYATRPGEKTKNSKDTLAKLRRDPLVAQLKSRRSSSSERKAALGSVCNLLYYTLNPSSTPPDLDLYWDEYVVNIIGQCLTPTNMTEKPDQAQRDLMDACLILTSLFNSTIQRPWNENRAMIGFEQNSVEAKELPALDSKWLRRSSSRVFPVLSPLLQKLYWDLGEDSQITNLLQAYITSIASPAAMEIKVSTDTLASLASIFDFLYRVWNTGPKSLTVAPWSKSSSNSDFLRSFEKVLFMTIQGLGLLPFTDRQLCIGKDVFLPVATPSHRPAKVEGETRSPFHHIVCLMATVSPGLEYDGRFSQMVRSILLPFFEDKKSGKARINLAKDLLQYLPLESTQPCKMIWRVLADFATTATDTREDSIGSNDHPIGVDYRSVVRILEAGVSLSPREPLPGWNTLFEALVSSATLDAGHAGKAIAVIEPLAKFFIPQNPKTAERSYSEGLLYFHLVITRATYPKDRQALDAARKKLWGAANAGPKLATFDPYVQLYDYVRLTLESTYGSFSKRRIHGYTTTLSSTRELLGRCPEDLSFGMLIKVQEGLSKWILDPDDHLVGGTDLSKEVSALWLLVCSRMATIVDSCDSSKVLADFTPLVCSGLESKHKPITSQAIRMWNSTFGLSKQNLVYPDRTKDALERLRPLADLQLPFFPESLESQAVSEHRQPIDFAESQEDSSFLPTTSMESVMKKHRTPLPGSGRLHNTTPQVIITVPSSASRKRAREGTLQMGKRKSRKQDITPKLRHMDSQIRFEAVASSPVPGAVEESQVLTERQKEVKERQQAEAAMFPDLRSSPRPKGKEVARDENAEPELPLHRSSSRSRTRSPLRTKQAERQSTPTPIPASEDDNFIVSSPTPKRNSQPHFHPSGVSSSPPESIIEKQAVIAATEPEVPSSPPEMLEETDFELTTSVEYPSAQIDPYAIDIDRTVSTFESTPGQKHHVFVDGVASQLETSTDLHSSVEVGVDVPFTSESIDEPQLNLQLTPVARKTYSLGEEPPASSPVSVKMAEEHYVAHKDPSQQTEVEPPSTPSRATRSQDSKPNDERTSSPVQYVDALSSPASSEKHTGNEEIFQDAVSSPRLMIDATDKKSTSSPMSDMDESSVMRMMEDYDEGSGRALATGQHRQTRASLKKLPPLTTMVSANTSSPGSMRKAALINATTIQTGQTPGIANKQISPDEESPQSSLPSLIPETPAPKVANTSNKIIVGEEEFDPEDTIVVDASALEDYWNKMRFVKPKGRRSSTGRKRKHAESSQESEVPDSQETSPAKKSKGRKKKSSQSQTSQLSQELDASPINDANHSFASVDLDSFVQASLLDDSNHEPEANVTEAIKPDATDEAPEDGHEISGTDQFLTAAEDTGSPLEEAMPSDKHSVLDSPVSPDVEMIEETTIYDRALMETSNSTPALSSIAQDTAEDDVSAVDPISTISPAAASNDHPRAPSPTVLSLHTSSTAMENGDGSAPSPNTSSSKPRDQSDEQVIGVSIFQNVKNTLDSLITRLGTAAFSKSQISEIEDKLSDTKEQLYGAARRGRQGGT